MDDIFVVGQRRRPGENFPPAAGGGGGGTGGGDGVNQNELDPNEPPPPPSPPHACDNPETAKEWNADAAAAAAAAEIARLAAEAGEDGLEYRERGAWILQLPDGSFGFSTIIPSEPFDENGDAAVQLTYDGVDPTTIIGSIHSHPVGRHRPSGPSPRPGMGLGDTGHFAAVRNLMLSQGRDPNGARIYILARNQLGAGQAPYNQINFYNHENIEASQTDFEVGPEVNPNAQPCS